MVNLRRSPVPDYSEYFRELNRHFSNLLVTLSVTSYVTPGEQGLTAGASPGGPAPSVSQPQAQPASAGVTP